MKKIVIIGAGASGLFSAIKMSEKNYDITILEANDKPGRKILVTGNGRCNITNSLMSKDYFYCSNDEFVQNILNEFSYENTINEFNKMGVSVKNKDGYVYPNSMQATTVLNSLVSICNIKGIRIVTNTKVNSIEKNKDGKFLIYTKKNYNESKPNKNRTDIIKSEINDLVYEADKVLIACGSKASVKEDYSKSIYEFLRYCGHKINRQMPALCSIYATFDKKNKYIKDFLKNAQGVRTDINCSLYNENLLVTKSKGELQITDYGFSGIVIFQISSCVSRIKRDEASNSIRLCIDFIPSMNEDDILDLFRTQMFYEKKSLQDLFSGIINSKLAHELLMLYSNTVDSDIKPFNKNIADERLLDIIRFIKNCYFDIENTNSYKFAQVCTGGIDVSEIKESLESVHIKNLFFSGECIDVDGICGGYNLQWAWSSGYVAGRSMTND